jgi:hypothetical protein
VQAGHLRRYLRADWRTGVTGVQWVGLYTLIVCGLTLGVFGLVWLATRSERRTEPRTPRVVVRFDDYLRSCHDATEVIK